MTHSSFFLLPVFILALAGSLAAAEGPQKQRVFFGVYTGEKSQGIYTAVLDTATGKVSEPELAVATVNPSFLAIHPNQKLLYAVSEIDAVDGKKSGAVAAFKLDAASGKLELINRQPSEGAGPCHLVVDPAGKAVLVANYSGGNVASLPNGKEGALEKAASAIQHEGKGADPARQKAPHAHSINLDPAGRFAFAADLGLDKVLVYKFDPAKGTIVANDPPAASVSPGAGPRHFAFHPSGKFAYVINEMGNTVTVFSYDAERGALTTVEEVSTLPKDYKEASYTAEVVVHPSGKFLYGSNRGHDSLAIFNIDQKSGKLTLVGTHPTGGKFPRNFNIDLSGNFLLAANQNTNNIVVFRIDQATGALKETGQVIELASPVCVKFVPLP